MLMTPAVIREVRRRGAPAEVRIVDAPPGTSCPVVESVRGADLVLLVTEPTPFGLNDLQLAVVPVTIDGSFEILPRTGKWVHRHRLSLTIHEPIPPKCKGPENVKATMTEAYAAVESALPEKYKGMVRNDDQDR